jgi:hypothetical protein
MAERLSRFLPLVKADISAVRSDRPLMRWAAHSAVISLQGMPQTFSV